MKRVQFFGKLYHCFPPSALKHISLAYWIAKRAHDQQKRDDGSRYIEHPKHTAMLLLKFGSLDWREIALGLIHDVPEDCFIPYELLRRSLGELVADESVTLSKFAMSLDVTTGGVAKKRKKDSEYWRVIAGSSERVRRVKLADRLHNLSTCGTWSLRKQRNYVEKTDCFIVPFAHRTDPELANAIEYECRKIHRRIDPPAN
ncbi:MAG: HD domain-containing protein [bacterium]|nr:HD domain-containing protein [bacterium]